MIDTPHLDTPQPAPQITRERLHTRRIECVGYLRSDGLMDIESSMQDLSAQGTDLLFKRIEAGGQIHAMRILVTVDQDLVIQQLQVHSDAAPTAFCADSNASYRALEGLKIGPGFTAKVRALLGGTKGCTHLTELLGPVATTAFQTMYAHRRNTSPTQEWLQGEQPLPRPAFAETCQAYRADGEALKIIWPLHRRAL